MILGTTRLYQSVLSKLEAHLPKLKYETAAVIKTIFPDYKKADKVLCRFDLKQYEKPFLVVLPYIDVHFHLYRQKAQITVPSNSPSQALSWSQFLV